MKFDVRATPQAELQILEANLWWITNREKAPDLLDQELTTARERLMAAPLQIGRTEPNSYIPGVLSLLLPKTKRSPYYIVDEENLVVWIISIWGAVRELKPDFSQVQIP